MTDDAITLAAVIGLLAATGCLIGLLRPGMFVARWLVVAAGLVVLHGALLLRGYGLVPRLLTHTQWNWQGKAAALAGTLVAASLPWFGWRRSGLTLRQNEGCLVACVPVAVAYCLVFLFMTRFFPEGPASPETIAFQLTMPGFEEEPFYRGILLFALDRAFLGRAALLGVEWGWGPVLSCALFGLAHALDHEHGRFSFDAPVMAMTALPSLVAVWLRLRSGSVLLPIVIHNFGNSIFLLV